MKKSFRVFSLLLVLIMLFGAFNVSGYTEEKIVNEEIEEDEVVIEYPQGVVEYTPPSITSQTQASGDTRSTTIEDGVYAIMSCAQTNRWMTVEEGKWFEGAHIQHKYSTTSPASSFDRSSLFKISRYGTTDRYIIRSMVNNRTTIDITSSGVITKMIPALDSEVSTSDMFFIEDTEDGYCIYSCSGRYAINLESTSTANLSYVRKTAATLNAKWNLIKYTGQDKSGMISTCPSSWRSIGGIVGDVAELRIAAWSTYINANVVLMNIRSGYRDLGEAQWDPTANTMLLTAKKPGEIILNIALRDADGTNFFSGYFVYRIVPQEGTYYIQNAGTERYIDIEGPSTSAGAIIQQWQYHVGLQEKWNIEHVDNSGGYVRLKSEYSNLYLGIDSANTASVKQYSTQNDYTLWMIDRSTAGNLIFKCKATESTGVVLAAPLNANANGTDLVQITYTYDTNTRDEWYLIEKVISYVNYYDDTFAHLTQKIPNSNRFANLVFSRWFNIGMYIDDSASPYYTGIENCPMGDDVPCSDSTCGSDCNTSHHKNSKVLSDKIYYSPREDDHLYVLWTTRNKGVYCREENGVHTTISSLASVFDKRPVIIFRNVQGPDYQITALMGIVLVHETAHSFKMDEVYDDEGHDVYEATECVMERFDRTTAHVFYQNVWDGTAEPFCPWCVEDMEGHTSNIIINGN